MKKSSLLAVLFALCLPLLALAQEAPKVELFSGYSYLQIHSGEGIDNIGGQGFNTSLAGNLNNSIGLVAEFSRFRRTDTFNLGELFDQPGLGAASVKSRVSTYMFGPRFKLRTGSAEPFVHALFGGAHSSFEAAAGGVSGKMSGNAFAYALGGGLDIKLRDSFAIRLGQVDYLRTNASDEGLKSLRYSIGFVIRLGAR